MLNMLHQHQHQLQKQQQQQQRRGGGGGGAVSPNSSGGYSRNSGNMSPNQCGDMEIMDEDDGGVAGGDEDDDGRMGGRGCDDGDEGDEIGIEDSQSLNAGTNGEWTYEEQFKQV